MKIDSIIKDVNLNFSFLYEKGFKIRSANYHPEAFGNWEIAFESYDHIIEISSDRNEIFVEFLPLHGDNSDRIGLRAMIYYISKGQKFIPSFEGNLFWGKNKQLKGLAVLLQENIDYIKDYFGERYPEHRDELLSAQKKYNQLSIDQYAKRIKY